mmetsp:Transcript_112993/g.176563  ORF Transcript_112993/g.176563 Transcript_112993/m.176563 type:complete len:109 (+) Transcript_112993:192-518(+)
MSAKGGDSVFLLHCAMNCIVGELATDASGSFLVGASLHHWDDFLKDCLCLGPVSFFRLFIFWAHTIVPAVAESLRSGEVCRLGCLILNIHRRFFRQLQTCEAGATILS